LGGAGLSPVAAYVHDARAFVRRTPDCVLVLGAAGSAPLALRGTALSIWDALASPRSVDDVAQELAASYGAPVERVGAEVASLVEELHGRGVLAPRHGCNER
jgi:hypothetical protein